MEKLVLSKNMLTTVKKSLIESLSIASGTKKQATYYHNREEQTQALKKHVRDLYDVSKELPLIVASQKGATGSYISEVLLNELNMTQKGGACNIINPVDWYDGGLGENALLCALNNLDDAGITYVLRFFVDTKNHKINNERTRKIVLGYLWGHSNLEFFAIKYRNKLKEVLSHVYGAKKTSILLSIANKSVGSSAIDVNTPIVFTDQEQSMIQNSLMKFSVYELQKTLKILLFIFGEDIDSIDFTSSGLDLLNEYKKAKEDVLSVENIPEEVLCGLISNPTHPQHDELWSTEEKRNETKAKFRTKVKVTSVNQQVRQTKSTAKLGVQKNVDMSKATDFLALYKTGYETRFTPEIKNAIEKLAEKKKITDFAYNNIGIIVDKSNSMKGHKQESKNTPRAIVDFTSKVLGKSAGRSKVVGTDGFNTDLANSFVELIKQEDENAPFEAIFILTDGYENAYDGLLSEVVTVYLNETGKTLPIFQISPITGAETGSNVRKLGGEIVSITTNDPISIKPQIEAKMLEVDPANWLEKQAQRIEMLPYSRYKK